MGDPRFMSINLLEVPDSIIGAVLGPRAKTLVEIQQLSGCKIEVHKRGQASTSNANGRLIRSISYLIIYFKLIQYNSIEHLILHLKTSFL